MRILKTTRTVLFMILILVMAGCSPAAPTPYADRSEAGVMEEEMEVEGAAPDASASGDAGQKSSGVSGDASVLYQTTGSDSLTIATRSNRLLVKDAEIDLLVKDTDTAIDLATQLVDDVDGYIISSRVWYEDWGKDSYKHAVVTIGVPVDQFERTLRRLRGIAEQVLDENATGEDVTEQYVDLESRLENLEATRDRIRGFLDQTDNVEEALLVNEELSDIEGQIAEVKGKMNYLSDRAAYSTITITLEPEVSALPTPTPTPTPTPVPWTPGESIDNATHVLGQIYRGLFDVAIWVTIVLLPVIGPMILVGWFIWRFLQKRIMESEQEEQS